MKSVHVLEANVSTDEKKTDKFEKYKEQNILYRCKKCSRKTDAVHDRWFALYLAKKNCYGLSNLVQIAHSILDAS